MPFVFELPLGLVVQRSLPGDARFPTETLPVGDAERFGPFGGAARTAPRGPQVSS